MTCPRIRGWKRMLLGVALGVAVVPLAAGQDHAKTKNRADEQRIVQDSAPMPMPPSTAKEPAVVKMILPANSMVWIEKMKMTSTGPLRLFQSPPLDPAKAYLYRVKVSWPTLPGQPDFVMEQEVTIKAGQTTTVDYTPVVQTTPSQPAPPAKQAGHVQPPTVNPPPYVQPPSRLPARRQFPGRGGY
jgi:uncharacterized protein (TIGR03000 family)